MSDQCRDLTRSPRGWLRCTLPYDHALDPLSMHQVDFDIVIPYDVLDRIAELTRQRDDARALAVNAGAFTDERETYRRATLADAQVDAIHDVVHVFGGLTYPMNLEMYNAALWYADECRDDARRIAIEAGAFL